MRRIDRERGAAGRGAECGGDQRHARMVAEAPPQPGDESRLRLDRDDPRAEAEGMRGAIAEVSADIEAQIARADELAIEGARAVKLQRIAAIDHRRSRD